MSTNQSSDISAEVIQIARKADPDRFFCALLAPQSARGAILLAIAFNHEITRAVANPLSSSVAGPMAGLIRLQWWREIIEGGSRQHELAPALQEAMGQGALHAPTLMKLLDAREQELHGVDDWEMWRTMMLGSAGAMVELSLRSMGHTEQRLLDVGRALGAAYGVGGLLRHLPAVLAAGRYPLPESALEEAGIARDAPAGLPAQSAIKILSNHLVREGGQFLSSGFREGVPPVIVPGVLPGVFARRDIARGNPQAGPRRIGDKLAVVIAGVRRRI